SRVKVGHRQALTAQKTPVNHDWGFLLWEYEILWSCDTHSVRLGSERQPPTLLEHQQFFLAKCCPESPQF
ncbi:hypothetical protein ACFOW3_24270, partial [Acidovorax facilis]